MINSTNNQRERKPKPQSLTLVRTNMIKRKWMHFYMMAVSEYSAKIPTVAHEFNSLNLWDKNLNTSRSDNLGDHQVLLYPNLVLSELTKNWERLLCSQSQPHNDLYQRAHRFSYKQKELFKVKNVLYCRSLRKQ